MKLYSRFKIFHKKRKLAIFALDYPSKIKHFKVSTTDTFHDHCSSKLSKMVIWPFQALRVKSSVTINLKLLLYFFMVYKFYNFTVFYIFTFFFFYNNRGFNLFYRKAAIKIFNKTFLNLERKR